MKYAINSAAVPDPAGPWSAGTTAGRLVFVSGQIATHPKDDTVLVGTTAAEQTERIVDLIELVVSEVGCALSDIAQITIYLADLTSLPEVDEVLAQRFSSPEPARSVVEVAQLPLDALVEISAVACR